MRPTRLDIRGIRNTTHRAGYCVAQRPGSIRSPMPRFRTRFPIGAQIFILFWLRLLEKLFYDSLEQCVGNGVDVIPHGFPGFGLCGKRFR